MQLILLIPFFMVIFIVFFFMPITIRIIYQRKGEDDHFSLDVFTVLKVLGFNVKIPYLQNRFISLFTEFFIELDSVFLNLWPGKKELSVEEEISWKNINLSQIRKILGVLMDFKLNKIIFDSLKIKCTYLKWLTEYGWSDPAYTGISNGFIWALKGILLGYANSKINFIKEPEILVKPYFDQEVFITRIEGIFSFLIGNIILTAIRILLYKIRGGFILWANIQLKN